MGFWNIVWAEMKFIYGDIMRRKSVLFIFLAYPYVLTLFIVLIGYGAGNRQVFIEKVGVAPEIFYLVNGFILMSVLGVSDDLLWRPIFDEWMGTLPYVIASPVNRLYRYLAIPIPRLFLVVLTGVTSVVPVMIYYYGIQGFVEGATVILLGIIASITFVTPILVIMGVIYSIGGESWRVINIVRPVLLILLGTYYPRFLMPLSGRIASYLIPSSHVVEVIQRVIIGNVDVMYSLTLLGVGIALFILYAPPGLKLVSRWESKKLKEGVKTE